MGLTLFFLISFCACFLASLVGLGGGFILIPALTHIAKVEFKDAVFLSLACVFFLSLLKLHGHRDLIKQETKRILPLIFCAGVGALSASYALPYFSSEVLEFSFGFLLLGVGLHLIFSKDRSDEGIKASSPITYPLFFVSGLLAGLFGIGGGVLNVPLLHKSLRYPMQEATILSFFFVFFSSGVALIVQFQNRREFINELNPMIIVLLIEGALLGYLLSRRLKISNRQLKLIFSAILIAVAIFQFI